MGSLIPCNCCGYDSCTVIFPAGQAQINRIVRCNRCGLMFASPRAKEPDSIEIAQYDPTYNPLHPEDTRVMKERLQVRDYDKTRAMLNAIFSARGSLLEVGSGLGYLLAAFRQDGWAVTGVEPFYQCCRYAHEELGLQTCNGTLDESQFADETFDVVLLNHVIEHLDNPLKTLLEIHRILKPQGFLVIETPRYDSLMFKLLRHRERSIRCGGHIYFFTTKTLQQMYQRAGFALTKLDYVGRSLTIERLLYNIRIVTGIGCHRLPLNTKKTLYINFRDMQRVCVQKQSLANQHLRDDDCLSCF